MTKYKFYKDPTILLFLAIAGINLLMASAMLKYMEFSTERTAEIESSLIELEWTVGEFVFLKEQEDFRSGNQTSRKRYNGLYWRSNDYYCIWVKERDPLNIALTEQHEYCHSLIDLDNESHFCEPMGKGEQNNGI